MSKIKKKVKANSVPYYGTPYNSDHSYGRFGCVACSTKCYSNRGEEMFCPKCSGEMSLEADADLSGLGNRRIIQCGICSVCNSVMASDLKSPDYCPQCGSDFLKAEEDVEDVEEVIEDIEEEDAEANVNAEEEVEEEDNVELLEDAADKIEELTDELEGMSGQNKELQARAVVAATKVHTATKKLKLAIKADDDEAEDEATEELQDAVEELEEIENELPEEDAAEEATEEDTEEEATEEDTEEEAIEEDTEEEPEAFYLNDIGEENILASDINMALYGTDTEDPYWNVTIKGQPIARVALSKQPRPDEIREAFIAPDYAENVAQAIEKLGGKDVLSSINAEYFANSVNRSELAAEIREEVLSELDVEFKNKLASMREDLLHCASIVMAGANKNFFAEDNHVLKATLWQNLKNAGISDAMTHIEAAFDTSGNEFFSWTLDKAIAFMDKPREAVDEIAKAIGEMNTMSPEEEDIDPLVEPEEDTLAERLAKGNVNFQAMKSVSASTKEDIRKRIQLGRR